MWEQVQVTLERTNHQAISPSLHRVKTMQLRIDEREQREDDNIDATYLSRRERHVQPPIHGKGQENM